MLRAFHPALANALRRVNHAPATVAVNSVQLRRMATKQRIITGASLRANKDRSEAGVAPIDVDGEIQLIDESNFDAAEGADGEAVEVDDFDQLDQLDAPSHSKRKEEKVKEKAKEKAKVEKKQVPITATRGDAQAAASRTAAFTEQREQRLAAAGGNDVAGPDAETRASSAHWDDLTIAPEAPVSSTHSSARRPDAQWEALDAKASWQQARKPSRRERERTERGEMEGEGEEGAPRAAEEQNAPAWGNLKHAAMPSIGWAEARARALVQQHLQRSGGAAAAAATSAGAAAAAPAAAAVDPANPFAAPGDVAPAAASSSGTVWTDEELLTLFPHLRTTAQGAVGKSGSVVLGELVADVRRRYPELEKLHYGSTLIKVRKWRELLGATRGDLPTDVGALIASENAAAPPSPAASPSPSAPANALHHRYHQSDIFLTTDDVSNILMRQRDLLYVNIEKVVVPRLSILRTHLPGVNLSAVILRNPGLLLSDLHLSLPLKLRELKAIFPEVNLSAMLEKDAAILSHAASSHILPRVNLFASASGYDPRHVVQFLAVEHPTLLTLRWNRMKRVEIVRNERFWTWWESHPLRAVAAPPAPAASEAALAAAPATDAGAAADATTAAESSSEGAAAETPAAVAVAPAAPKANDPATLPFALYHELLTMTSEAFHTTFPWWSIESAYTPLERELFAAQAHAQRDTAARKAADDRGATLPATAASGSAAARHALGTVSAAMLASVPGNPQPLSLALGLTPDAQLSRDELRAKQRMDYLALKARKREEREARKDFMRAQERAHQQKKMGEYTSRFQSYRSRTLAATQVQPREEEQERARIAAASAAAPTAPASAPADNAWEGQSGRPSGSGGLAAPRRNATFDESSYPAPRTTRAAYAPRDDDSYAAMSSGGRDRRSGSGGNGSFSGYGRDRDNNRGDGDRFGGGGSGSGGDRGSFRDRTRGDRGGFQQPHQKNRPGSVQSQRHQAHPQGRVESFGARPTPTSAFGQQQFGQKPPSDSKPEGGKPAPRWRV